MTEGYFKDYTAQELANKISFHADQQNSYEFMSDEYIEKNEMLLAATVQEYKRRLTESF